MLQAKYVRGRSPCDSWLELMSQPESVRLAFSNLNIFKLHHNRKNDFPTEAGAAAMMNFRWAISSIVYGHYHNNLHCSFVLGAGTIPTVGAVIRRLRPRTVGKYQRSWTFNVKAKWQQVVVSMSLVVVLQYLAIWRASITWSQHQHAQQSLEKQHL